MKPAAKDFLPFVKKKKYHELKKENKRLKGSFKNFVFTDNLQKALDLLENTAKIYWNYSQSEIKSLKVQNEAFKWLVKQINQQKKDLETIAQNYYDYAEQKIKDLSDNSRERERERERERNLNKS